MNYSYIGGCPKLNTEIKNIQHSIWTKIDPPALDGLVENVHVQPEVGFQIVADVLAAAHAKEAARSSLSINGNMICEQ